MAQSGRNSPESTADPDSSKPTRRRRRASQPSIARQACDACRLRRTRCVVANDLNHSPVGRRDAALLARDVQGSSSPCQRCVTFGIACTFRLPVKTRGPRKKELTPVDSTISPTEISPSEELASSVPSLPFDITSNMTSLGESNGGFNEVTGQGQNQIETGQHHISPDRISVLSPGSHHAFSPQSRFSDVSPYDYLGLQCPTDRLCSRPLVDAMLNDYLELLYPMVPVVHRPSFLLDLAQHRDFHDPDFLGLIIAMCGVLVATIPRKFQEYRTCATPLRFQSRTEMVHFCCDWVLHARRPAYFDEISLHKWATSYLLYLAYFQIGHQNRSRMLEVEAMQLARLLNLQNISSYDGLNVIETQLRKKAFWLMFYGYVHCELHDLRKEKLTFLDPTFLRTINLHELMPLEVDDEYIHEDSFSNQPDGRISLTTGFNVCSRVFWASIIRSSRPRDSHDASEDYCGCNGIAHSSRRLSHLKERLQDLKYILDQTPAPLRQWKTSSTDDIGEPLDSDLNRLLNAQFESMRANIHVTHLWLQSVIFEEINTLERAAPASAPTPLSPLEIRYLWHEREDLCRQLLHVLHSIPHVHLEPNGNHLTHKIRDVAVTLLDCPFGTQDGEARRAHEYLQEFTKILSRLDGSETVNTVSLQSWVDAARQGKMSVF